MTVDDTLRVLVIFPAGIQHTIYLNNHGVLKYVDPPPFLLPPWPIPFISSQGEREDASCLVRGGGFGVQGGEGGEGGATMGDSGLEVICKMNKLLVRAQEWTSCALSLSLAKPSSPPTHVHVARCVVATSEVHSERRGGGMKAVLTHVARADVPMMEGLRAILRRCVCVCESVCVCVCVQRLSLDITRVLARKIDTLFTTAK